MSKYESLQKYSLEKFSSFGNYKGIPIYAANNLHEEVFSNFRRLNLPLESRILVLGSGGGAFDQRLADTGYINVVSTDFIEESFKAVGTNFIKKDLNYDFDDLGEFDIIFALEVIEHLENQFHFIKNISQCLKKDGILFISSPSIDSKYSRIHHLINGTLYHFTDADLSNTGHINPVFEHILKYNLNNNNLYIVEKSTNFKAIPEFPGFRALRSFLGYFIYRLLFLATPGNNNHINIYTIKNKTN